MTAAINRPTIFSYPTLNLSTIDTQMITARRISIFVGVYFLATSAIPSGCALLFSALILDCALHVVTEYKKECRNLREELQGHRDLVHYYRTELREQDRTEHSTLRRQLLPSIATVSAIFATLTAAILRHQDNPHLAQHNITNFSG